MVKTGITIISVALMIANSFQYKVRVKEMEKRNTELLSRLSSVTSMCVREKNIKANMTAKIKRLKKQLEVIKFHRPGSKERLSKLKKLLKERNNKFGIGGYQ